MTADQRSDSMSPHFRTYCPVQLQLTMIVGLLVVVLGCDPITETQPDSRAKRSDVTDRSGVSSEGSSLPAIQPEEKVTALDRDESLAAVDSFLNKKKPDQAVSLLKAMLVKNPTDVEVIFRLAMVTGNQGNLEAAIDLLAAIPPDHPQAGFPAVGQSADWCLQLGRYDEAEERYRRLLVDHPNAPEANRKLAFLLNRRGRRHEAAQYITQLCMQGNVRNDELHALVHLSDAMYDDPQEADGIDDEQAYYPIGPVAVARKLFMEEDYQAALKLMRERVPLDNLTSSVLAFYGRVTAEAQDDDEFYRWLANTDDDTRECAEYWAAIGTHLLLHGKLKSAARGLLEALDRDPTDLRSIGRLRSLLETLEYHDSAALWEERWQTLRRTLRINNQIADAQDPNADAMLRLASELESVGRRLEANLWRLIAAHYAGTDSDELKQIQSRFHELIEGSKGLPSPEERLCGLDRELFPLPKLAVLREAKLRKALPERLQSEDAVPGFVNVAKDFGLQHTFHVAKEPNSYGFAVYQSIGGAVAVLDYDLDGMVDLYFAQGGCDPPAYRGTETNQLYRNLGSVFSESTSSASAEDFRYSIGVTAGDWNQDGFDDLVVGNLGANSLLINNGDGTFTKSQLDNRDDKAVMTTSLAMADITGDAIPDLFEVNYLDDERLPRRPEISAGGEVLESMNPMDFTAGADRFFIHAEDGSVEISDVTTTDGKPRAGLGVVIGNFGDGQGKQVFIANDLYPNQFWRYQPETGNWLDQAMLRGCAHGFNGGSTAAMGVAAGDLNGNGMLDLHVTNFQNESVSLFVNEHGFFQDRNVQFGLARSSLAVLGFGTQGLDYDNDGTLDLVVANGHIENASDLKAPFMQPAQLFRNHGVRFEQMPVIDPSGYWQRDHLGRALAKLDFNSDGQQDFVVTHLGEPSALLMNQTGSSNHWLQLEIVGVVSERDAVGSRVVARHGDREVTDWLNAGDGFLCRNQQLLCFGLGSATKVDELAVHWPSGKRQVFHDVPVDQRYLLVEGQAELFPQVEVD